MSRKAARGGKRAKRKQPAGRKPQLGSVQSIANSSAPSPIRAARPNIPGYGIVGEAEGRGLLPWSWAEQRLAGAHNYWLATTRPDGRPHVMPVWGLWWEGAFYFSTGDKTVKARNLAANPQCVVCPDLGAEAVIVEGAAELIPASPAIEPLWAAYKKKYAWEVKGSPFYAVRPRAAFGFIEKNDLFTKTATRWTFSSFSRSEP
ncbi:MAG TPA: pyridoxamine 5'-phosphate oxidase family protein [Candidatus Acidoferrales bacterium]|nr:pyridoxamine 5'-phosphate oxidase family protein [Candidatus Acidoferrales bacterium]